MPPRRCECEWGLTGTTAAFALWCPRYVLVLSDYCPESSGLSLEHTAHVGHLVECVRDVGSLFEDLVRYGVTRYLLP